MTAFLRRLAATCGLVIMGLVAGAAGAQQAAAAQAATEDARLAAFFEEVFQRNLKDSPIFQAQLGMKGPDYGKWGDFSDQEANRQNELTKGDLARLRSEFKYESLSPGMKVSYRIFELQQQTAVSIFPWRFHNYAFSTHGQPGDAVRDLHAEHPPRRRRLGCGGLHLPPEPARADRRGRSSTNINTAARARHRADLVLVRPGDRRRARVLTGAPFDGSGKDSALLADFRGKVEKLEATPEEKKRLLDQGIAAMRGR